MRGSASKLSRIDAYSQCVLLSAVHKMTGVLSVSEIARQRAAYCVLKTTFSKRKAAALNYTYHLDHT